MFLKLRKLFKKNRFELLNFMREIEFDEKLSIEKEYNSKSYFFSGHSLYCNYGMLYYSFLKALHRFQFQVFTIIYGGYTLTFQICIGYLLVINLMLSHILLAEKGRNSSLTTSGLNSYIYEITILINDIIQ